MHYVTAKAILSPKNELNIYRGCSYGCIYCEGRNRLLNKMDGDFSDIEVKKNAIELLNLRLSTKKEKCMIKMGYLTDPYNEADRELKLTREALEAIYMHSFGVAILTKSELILRDIDLLKKINSRTKAVVMVGITTADSNLSAKLEPKASPISERIKLLNRLHEEGIPTVVYMSPLLPYINDTEENLKAILNIARDTGAKGIVYYGPGLEIKEGNRRTLYAGLDKIAPIIRRRYQREFKGSMAFNTANASVFDYIIKDFCEKNNLLYDLDEIFYYIENFDAQNEQLALF